MSGAMKLKHCAGMAVVGAALFAVVAPVRAGDSGFLKEVDDLPLAPGLVEQPGGTLFDAPQGRIVEAAAQGRLLEVEARQFYDESLPQLGWTQVGSSTYRRDKEVLHIEYSEGLPMVVHFSLTPARAGSDDGKDNDKGKEKEKDKDLNQNPSQGGDEGVKQ